MSARAYRSIGFRRTGGLAAVRPVEVAVDLTADDPDTRRLAAMLAELDVGRLEAAPSARAATPDAYRYELDVEDGEARHRVVVGDGAIPSELRPLIRALERRAVAELRARRAR